MGKSCSASKISIHAPRAGCDLAFNHSGPHFLQFQSTHPVRGATPPTWKLPLPVCISIHAPRAGCDGTGQIVVCILFLISIHAPRAGCDVCGTVGTNPKLISIHAPRAGCDRRSGKRSQAGWISIHAPRAGCDGGVSPRRPRRKISIHAPRAGCDLRQWALRWSSSIFQSTHPVRGATLPRPPPWWCCRNFNPRTPCGVRPADHTVGVGRADISIHAPRAGCDASRSCVPAEDLEFQSTHPVRGATLKTEYLLEKQVISIHAPRAGCDGPVGPGQEAVEIFQSTHPVRGATSREKILTIPVNISIHAPRAGCDGEGTTTSLLRMDFNPRTPCGVRRDGEGEDPLEAEFQSTHPVRGATHG